jgi:hypothetical protein
MPFQDEQARELILQKFSGLAADGGPLLPSRSEISEPIGPPIVATSVGRALREYRASAGVGRAVVRVTSSADVNRIVASGAVFRMDPVRRVSLASAPEEESDTLPSIASTGPTVAVIDGGLTDSRYSRAEAWRTTPLVPDTHADSAHGNAIASIIAHGSLLNPSLNLPDLRCRLGIAQAVPLPTSDLPLLPNDLFDLLARIGAAHRDTRVWNMSFNLEDFDDDPELMSDFGHQISLVARAADALPVISIGNVTQGHSMLLPPGDAEAALTVGGRTAKNGLPHVGCASCCEGPGPGGVLVFSNRGSRGPG